MQRRFDTRISALEAAHPSERWSIAIEWVAGWNTANPHVVATLPARRLAPGEVFDYASGFAAVYAAMDADDAR
jgi:hypothetical protein